MKPASTAAARMMIVVVLISSIILSMYRLLESASALLPSTCRWICSEWNSNCLHLEAFRPNHATYSEFHRCLAVEQRLELSKPLSFCPQSLLCKERWRILQSGIRNKLVATVELLLVLHSKRNLLRNHNWVSLVFYVLDVLYSNYNNLLDRCSFLYLRSPSCHKRTKIGL